MARLDIPINEFAARGSVVVPSAGTIDTTDGVSVPCYGYTDQILIIVENGGDAGTISVVPGANPPAIMQALGTVTIACGGTARASFLLEGMRVMQTDGDVDLDFSSGMSGSVYAYNTRVTSIA